MTTLGATDVTQAWWNHKPGVQHPHSELTKHTREQRKALLFLKIPSFFRMSLDISYSLFSLQRCHIPVFCPPCCCSASVFFSTHYLLSLISPIPLCLQSLSSFGIPIGLMQDFHFIIHIFSFISEH